MADSALDELKLLLGIDGDEQDGPLAFALASVEELMLAYLNTPTLPEALSRVRVLMTASYCRAAGIPGGQPATGAVTSVRRGDVTTSFAAPDNSGNFFDLGDGDGFFGWRQALNAHRRLR